MAFDRFVSGRDSGGRSSWLDALAAILQGYAQGRMLRMEREERRRREEEREKEKQPKNPTTLTPTEILDEMRRIMAAESGLGISGPSLGVQKFWSMLTPEQQAGVGIITGYRELPTLTAPKTFGPSAPEGLTSLGIAGPRALVIPRNRFASELAASNQLPGGALSLLGARAQEAERPVPRMEPIYEPPYREVPERRYASVEAAKINAEVQVARMQLALILSDRQTARLLIDTLARYGADLAQHLEDMLPYTEDPEKSRYLIQQLADIDEVRAAVRELTAKLRGAVEGGLRPKPLQPGAAAQPTAQPTTQPTTQPTASGPGTAAQPTPQPTAQPAAQPTAQPTAQPAAQPAPEPTPQPTPGAGPQHTPAPTPAPVTAPPPSERGEAVVIVTPGPPGEKKTGSLEPAPVVFVPGMSASPEQAASPLAGFKPTTGNVRLQEEGRKERQVQGQQFRREERLGGQQFRREERLGGQQFRREERLGGQQFRTAERQAREQFLRSERLARQKKGTPPLRAGASPEEWRQWEAWGISPYVPAVEARRMTQELRAHGASPEGPVLMNAKGGYAPNAYSGPLKIPNAELQRKNARRLAERVERLNARFGAGKAKAKPTAAKGQAKTVAPAKKWVDKAKGIQKQFPNVTREQFIEQLASRGVATRAELGAAWDAARRAR